MTAYYSAMAKEMYGSVIWISTSGLEVEITAIQTHDNATGKIIAYVWEDAVELQVTKYIREGHRPQWIHREGFFPCPAVPRTKTFFGYPCRWQ